MSITQEQAEAILKDITGGYGWNEPPCDCSYCECGNSADADEKGFWKGARSALEEVMKEQH